MIKSSQVISAAHHKDVSCCALSASNGTLLTGSLDCNVKVWKLDVETKKFCEDTKLSPLQPKHKYGVTVIKFSPGEVFFATASMDGHIFLYSSTDFQLLNTLTQTGNQVIRSLSFSPNSSLMVTGDDSGTLCTWKFENQQLLSSYNDHEGSIKAIVFSGDSCALVTCCSFGLVMVWRAGITSLNLEKVAFVEQAHDLGVNCADFYYKNKQTNQNQYWLVTGGNDSLIKVWKIELHNRKITNVWTLQKHNSNIVSLSVNQNGHWLATADTDAMIYLWRLDASEPSVLTCLSQQQTKYVNAVVFSKDSQWLVSCSGDQSVVIWSLAECHPMSEPGREPAATDTSENRDTETHVEIEIRRNRGGQFQNPFLVQ